MSRANVRLLGRGQPRPGKRLSLKYDPYYALSGGHDPPLFTSPDMQEWRLLGPLFHEQTQWEKLRTGVARDRRRSPGTSRPRSGCGSDSSRAAATAPPA